jgi:hypothetical protein
LDREPHQAVEALKGAERNERMLTIAIDTAKGSHEFNWDGTAEEFQVERAIADLDATAVELGERRRA